MSVLGTSRFTALLAAVALSGTAGTFWWALETRSDMRTAANSRTVSRTLPVKAGSRAPHSKDEPAKIEAGKPEPGKEPNKFELMGKIEPVRSGPKPTFPSRAGSANEDTDQGTSRSLTPRLANYPIPGQGSAPRGLVSRGRADMPLPAMPVRSEPAPLPWQVKAPDSPLAFAAPAPAPPPSPPPAETPKRQTRDPRPEPPAAAAPRQPKLQSFYTEQFIEQGEFRYRRRPCEPPNMPDVCFMPQADRHPIVVAKP